MARVLPQVYAVNQEAIHGHVMALASLLPLCDTPEKISLLSLLNPIARNRPSLLEASLPQLCDCLAVTSAIPATLQLLTEMASYKASLLVDYAPRIKDATDTLPSVASLAAQVMTRLGHLNLERGQDALEFIVELIIHAENHNIPSLLREVAALCSTHPTLLTDRLLHKLESHVESAPSVAKNIYQQMKASHTNQRSSLGIQNSSSNVTLLKLNGGIENSGHQQHTVPTNHHRLSLPLQAVMRSGNLSSASGSTPPTNISNRSSLGGFVNVGNMSVPISVASAVFSGAPVYNSQGIPVLLTIGPSGLNITNATTSTTSAIGHSTAASSNPRVVGRTKQADASRSTPRLTPALPASSAAAAAVMNRSMSWINAVHMQHTSSNRLSPSPANPSHKGARFGSSHQMAPYGHSREAHGPGIHNPNQGGRGSVFPRGSLSTNRVQVSSTVGGGVVSAGLPSSSSVSTASNPVRSVSGSLTTMREDQEADMRLSNLLYGHNNPNIGMVGHLGGANLLSPSPTAAISLPSGRIHTHTPISIIPSSQSSLAPSPPPIIQHTGGKLLDDMVQSADNQHHKASMNTLTSQSTLSFHNSNVTLSSNPSGFPPQQGQMVIRRHPTPSNKYVHTNGERGRTDNVDYLASSQRISVFEPYPMQDAVKVFFIIFAI